ncbi:MAG: HEAT repeat domain-containing protein [Polyangiaceae bacterium]|nr:HEAT repeat domain-containing protein [Polyangiaceae bacterium]
MRLRRRSKRSRILALALAAAASLAQLGAPGDASAFLWPNVPDQIARALRAGDVSERRLAAQRLGELPPETALALIQRAMGDPDVEVRLRVAQAAVSFRLPRAGDLVIEWLGEGDARLRLAACDVIRAAPTDRSVVALGRVLGDPDAHVRLAAAAAMGSSGLPDAVSPLLGHLDDGAPEVRAEVARALGRIADARAVVPLIGKVQDAVPEVRRAVARALGELGDARAVSALMLALQDTATEVRVEAVTALGRLRSDEATLAIAPLVDASDPDAGGRPAFPGAPPSPAGGATRGQVREAALRALGRIGSEAAVKALLGALAQDDPAAPRSTVREALVSAGKPAVQALVAVISGSPSGNAGAGAALALGQLKAKEGQGAIVRGMQRGVVPLRHGLRALAELGDPGALPTVLELLGDDDPSVRREAIRAAMALLDPARADGRAVDPARALLEDAATPLDERVELVKLLGRTGAPRARDVLLPLLKAKQAPLRLAALTALGSAGPTADEGAPRSTLRGSARPAALRPRTPTRPSGGATPERAKSTKGAGAVDAALLAALDDESPEVRLRAAAALARVSSAGTARELLRRLVVAAEQDRGALGIALAGALSRSSDAALAREVAAAVASAPLGARDALIEGLGRMRGQEAGAALGRLAGGAIDDRRKVAEALAGHPEASDALRRLARDPDPGVRANAVWTIGATGKKDALSTLGPMIKDPDVAVAGNAAGAVGRVAGREGDAAGAAALLCPALADARPYVRANALAGLTVARARCEGAAARDLLARDPAEAVRLAAADHLAGALAGKGADDREADRRALSRCAGEDRNATVALRCSRPAPAAGSPHPGLRADEPRSAPGPGPHPGLRADEPRSAPGPGPDDVAVFVIPDGSGEPAPRAPFALVRADGLMRLGIADRRGEIFEAAAPGGPIRLAVPAPLAR